ncbi:hypothetical protein R1flu_011110 [Riccia fluitans]|uniref:Uncharacterized protein n=1 Tax=Riccia fluitans TaxID=41844 RepID=A0ABD1Z721_9MARC
MARESITSLEAEDGSLKTKHQEIMQVIENHFTATFLDEAPSMDTLQLRAEALQLLHVQLSPQQKASLEIEPGLEEVEAVIAGMQKDKTLGLDGLTVEMVRKLWEKVKYDCMKMLAAVWRKKALGEWDLRGVIKLLPKSAEEKYFKATKEIVTEFEKISGAKLNLLKSVIMPLTPGAGESWLKNTGCEIAGEGQDFTYLGILSGCALDERKVANEIIKKISTKITHWTTRWLSQPARIVLLKHVLAAMPTYQILSVGMTEQGISRFESLCRNFIWGWNSEGNPRLATIAWWKWALRKEDGGIGWIPTKDRVTALQVRNIGHILKDKDCEWIDMAKSMIRNRLAGGTNKRERQKWSVQEALLLLKQLSIPGAPLLTRMLKVWFRVRTYLKREGTIQEIPLSASTQQLAALATLYTEDGSSWALTAVLLLTSVRIYEAAQLRDTTGSWKRLTSLGFLHGKHWSAMEYRCAVSWDEWMNTQSPCNKPLHLAHGWKWQKQEQERFDWIQPTKFWYKLLYKPMDLCSELNKRWDTLDAEEVWKCRWRHVWSCQLTPRVKLWWWKQFHRGFITGSGRSSIPVHRFPGLQPETQNEQIGHISIFYSYLSQLWKERCRLLFTSKRESMPIRNILENALLEIEAIARRTPADRIYSWKRNRDRILTWIRTSPIVSPHSLPLNPLFGEQNSSVQTPTEPDQEDELIQFRNNNCSRCVVTDDRQLMDLSSNHPTSVQSAVPHADLSGGDEDFGRSSPEDSVDSNGSTRVGSVNGDPLHASYRIDNIPNRTLLNPFRTQFNPTASERGKVASMHEETINGDAATNGEAPPADSAPPSTELTENSMDRERLVVSIDLGSVETNRVICPSHYADHAWSGPAYLTPPHILTTVEARVSWALVATQRQDSGMIDRSLFRNNIEGWHASHKPP